MTERNEDLGTSITRVVRLLTGVVLAAMWYCGCLLFSLGFYLAFILTSDVFHFALVHIMVTVLLFMLAIGIVILIFLIGATITLLINTALERFLGIVSFVQYSVSFLILSSLIIGFGSSLSIPFGIEQALLLLLPLLVCYFVPAVRQGLLLTEDPASLPKGFKHSERL